MYKKFKKILERILSIGSAPQGDEVDELPQTYDPDLPFTANEKKYLDLLKEIYFYGVQKSDRTDTGTISLHGKSITYDLKDSFPLFTTKFVAMKTAISEMVCFLNARTRLVDFHDLNCHVWDKFADDEGNLGPIYGAQWRNWKCSDGTQIDQIDQLFHLLKTKPNSRRLVVSAWNPEFLSDETVSPKENPPRGKMSLSPCHKDFQLLTRPMYQSDEIGHNNIHYLAEKFKNVKVLKQHIDNNTAPQFLDMVVGIRSNDMFLGHPFNAVQYAYLLSWISHCYGMIPGRLTFHIGDAHIYTNHIAQVVKQLGRSPFRAIELYFPTLTGQEDMQVYPFTMNRNDYVITQYRYHPPIPGDIAVG